MNIEATVSKFAKLVAAFDFTTYERIPAASREDDAFTRNVQILTHEQMAKIAGVPVEMISRWVRHGQVDPLRHAASQPVQLPDLARAKQAAKDSIPFVPRFARQPAEHVWITFLARPMGLRRLLSLGHRREMQNLDRGMPVNYVGPGDPITDELVSDMKGAMDKGESVVDVAINKLNPALHDKRAAEREAAPARP